jgi:hypothetical protein
VTDDSTGKIEGLLCVDEPLLSNFLIQLGDWTAYVPFFAGICLHTQQRAGKCL